MWWADSGSVSARLTSISSFTCSCWSRSSPKASIIRPKRDYNGAPECLLLQNLVEQGEQSVSGQKCVKQVLKRSPEIANLTLDDGQQDYNDKEEKCDVKDDAFHLKFISSWVLDLIPDSPACTNSNVHVEHVTLKEKIFHVSYCTYRQRYFSLMSSRKVTG